MSYYVYILKSKNDKKHYFGSTSNIEKRLLYHNTGKQIRTQHTIPFEMIYFENCSTKMTALKRENQIKSYKGGEALKKLIRLRSSR